MHTENFKLSDMQYDLLKELFNLGVGSAANSLSQLVHQEVMLSVPSILIETPEKLANRLGQDSNVFSVSQEMDGPFAMNSLIVFSPEDSFDVVRLMLDPDLSNEALAELQSEAMSEIGNIVLNACISVIAEALGESFSIQLPIFRDTTATSMLEKTMESSPGLLLSILVNMELKHSQVKGHLVFILNTDSMSNLSKTLNSMLEGFC